MRAAKGEPLISDRAIFTPHIPIVKTMTAKDERRFSNKFKLWIKKLQQMYQSALLELYRGTDNTGD